MEMLGAFVAGVLATVVAQFIYRRVSDRVEQDLKDFADSTKNRLD